MNRIMLLFVFLISYFVAGAQHSYSVIFTAPATDDYPTEMVETTKGDLIIVGLKRDYTNIDRAIVWKISNDGDTMTKVFNYGDTCSSFYSILLNNDETVSIFGSIFHEQNSLNKSLLVIRLDNSLNVINERIINIPGLNNIIIERSFSTTTNYYLAGYGTDNNNISKTVLVKLDSQYNLLTHQFFFENVNFNVTVQDLIMSMDQSLLYVFTGNAIPSEPTCHLLITDTSLNLKSLKPFPTNQIPGYLSSQFYNSVTAKILVNNNFIVGGTFYSHALYQSIQLDIGISYFDTSMTYQPMVLLGKVDTADNGGFIQCIDFRSEDSIFFAGSQRLISAPYPNDVSWIYTGMLHANLDLAYERWYGGDAHYMVISTITAKDGGYYISALRYDHNTPINGYDLSVFKLNNEGLITNLSSTNLKPTSVKVYPNPTSGYLQIESMVYGSFELINMCGQTLYSGLIHLGDNFIDISSLPNACYLLKFVSENKMTDYQKIIKQP